MQDNKTRQERAYEDISSTFVKLLENDKRIGYDHKRSVIAFWEDLFAHDGVRNNMIQAFSNFFEEIDRMSDAARKAGIVQMEEALISSIPALTTPPDIWEPAVNHIRQVRADLIKAENAPDEPDVNSKDLDDLSEVGGGNETNSPLI